MALWVLKSLRVCGFGGRGTRGQIEICERILERSVRLASTKVS